MAVKRGKEAKSPKSKIAAVRPSSGTAKTGESRETLAIFIYRYYMQ
jgi:hypothetical protein